jgi:hypothetical protein
LEGVKQGSWDIVSSEVLQFEVAEICDITRRESIFGILVLAKSVQQDTEEVEVRAEELQLLGFKALDALHLASAEASSGLPLPSAEFVKGEGVGGTGFDPWFLVGLGGVGFGAADHPGTITLDEGGGAFAGPGFTGSFEGGILQPLVVALVHHDDLAEVTGVAAVVQIPVESGSHSKEKLRVVG